MNGGKAKAHAQAQLPGERDLDPRTNAEADHGGIDVAGKLRRGGLGHGRTRGTVRQQGAGTGEGAGIGGDGRSHSVEGEAVGLDGEASRRRRTAVAADLVPAGKDVEAHAGLAAADVEAADLPGPADFAAVAEIGVELGRGSIARADGPVLLDGVADDLGGIVVGPVPGLAPGIAGDVEQHAAVVVDAVQTAARGRTGAVGRAGMGDLGGDVEEETGVDRDPVRAGGGRIGVVRGGEGSATDESKGEERQAVGGTAVHG